MTDVTMVWSTQLISLSSLLFHVVAMVSEVFRYLILQNNVKIKLTL